MSDKPIRGEWPAFPLHIAGVDEYKGMSLRDYFAGQVIAGLCANQDESCEHAHMARIAYDLADAMLKAREP